MPERKDPELVFVSGTFLGPRVQDTHVLINGYSAWVRRDHSTHGGGVAFCHMYYLNVVVLDISIAQELEIIFLKVLDSEERSTLCTMLQATFTSYHF